MIPFSRRIHEAFDFAALHHRKQTRKDPDIDIPYVSHLYGVSYLIAQFDFSEDAVIAAVLHDFLEDIVQRKGKPKLGEEFRERFGDHVYTLVELVTEQKWSAHGMPVSWHERRDRYRQRISSPDTPVEAKAISCADKIHNIESMLMAFERNRGNEKRMWGRLKASPKEQLMKFRMLHDAIALHWQHPLLDMLDARTKELETRIQYSLQCPPQSFPGTCRLSGFPR